jgi:hypothetical protein
MKGKGAKLQLEPRKLAANFYFFATKFARGGGDFSNSANLLCRQMEGGGPA